MSRPSPDCGLRVAGQEIDKHQSPGRLRLPGVAKPALAAVLAARIDGVTSALWHVGDDWGIPPRVVDDDFLFIPLHGVVDLTLRGRTWRLAPGGIAIVPVGDVHALRYPPGKRRELTVVAVHAHVRDAGGAPLLVDSTPPVLPLGDHVAWAGRLLLPAATDPPSPALLAASVRVLLAGLACAGLSLRLPVARGDGRLAPAFAMLHDHPEAPHTIPALAEACGLGAVRFRQLFRHAAGCAPKAYLDRLRLARARELLASSHRPVGAIAAASGYRSTRHFLARFHAATGCTPTAWRRGDGGI